jgi:hypothetical protein
MVFKKRKLPASKKSGESRHKCRALAAVERKELNWFPFNARGLRIDQIHIIRYSYV